MADKTKYVILRQDKIAASRATTLEAAQASEPREVWEEFGHAEGHNGQAACDAFLNETELSEGEYVLKAVPERSWPAEPQFEGAVARQLTVVARRKEPAHA